MISILMIAKLVCAFGLVGFGVALGAAAGALQASHDATTGEIDREIDVRFDAPEVMGYRDDV